MKTVTIDLHTHLLEKKVSPVKYWRKALERRLDAVAITEHAELNPKKAFSLVSAKKPASIVLIPGAELFTDIGHAVILADSEAVFEEKEIFEKRVSLKKVKKIANSNNWLLSIAHPWGFSGDSAAFIAGEKKLERIVQRGGIGVESYNGMIGNINSLVYDTNWIKRPFNFFEFLEHNRVSRRIMLDRVGRKMRSELEERIKEVLERSEKALELGLKADFITAGSDAHSANRVGEGIVKLKLAGKPTARNILDSLREKKHVEWAGPFVKEVGVDRYELLDEPVKKKEIFQGMKYATKRVISRKGKLKKLKEKISGGNETDEENNLEKPNSQSKEIKPEKEKNFGEEK